jgi:hypothetical protein
VLPGKTVDITAARRFSLVKAVQALQYLIRDPFGSGRTVTTS